MACGSLTKCEGVIKNSEVLEEGASLTYELSVDEGKTYVFEKMIACLVYVPKTKSGKCIGLM